MSNTATKKASPRTPPAKTSPKPTPRARAKAPAVASPAVPPAAPAAPAGKPLKRRSQLVRDSFTMPKADFDLVATLKSRAMTAQRQAKKSELLRAGLRALATLNPVTLAKALDELEPVKTGRPKKGQDAAK